MGNTAGRFESDSRNTKTLTNVEKVNLFIVEPRFPRVTVALQSRALLITHTYMDVRA